MTVKYDKNENFPYPTLEISAGALKSNLLLLRKIAHNKKILIPVKANAYGCGIKELLPFFNENQIDYLGVANPFEGKNIRTLGCKKPILLLGSFFPEHIPIIINHGLEPSLTDVWQIRALANAAEHRDKPIAVQIKLDLGMGRIGFLKSQISTLIDELKQFPSLKISGIFTHFPNAARPRERQTRKQLQSFNEVSTHIITQLKLKRENLLLHTANSYATIHYPESHFDLIRPGILFYGYFHSFSHKKKYGRQFPFKGAVKLTAAPISLRRLEAKTSISYGSTFVVPKNNFHVGVFPLGYGDGIPRELSNKKTYFGSYPLLGRVTMDQIILGGVCENKPIDILGGKGLAIEKAGDDSSSFSYEILCGIGNRIKRVLVD